MTNYLQNRPSNRETSGAFPASVNADRTFNAITGCVSKISLPLKNTSAYFSALKSFSALSSAQPTISERNDADTILKIYNEVAQTEEHRSLGMLGSRVLTANNFSDDEIAHCGYLGWLSL